jgi:nudix-type nucleoside diphosphatase (YffH/AdpP family)
MPHWARLTLSFSQCDELCCDGGFGPPFLFQELTMISSRIRIKQDKTVWSGWAKIRVLVFDYKRRDGAWEQQAREVYDRGHGAAILLYNLEHKSVVLVRQFRLACMLAGYGEFLIEVPAGMLDDDDPEGCIRREVEEETGYHIGDVAKVCEAFTTPGSVTEKLHFFMASYDRGAKHSPGGGAAEEGEDIEVLELPFVEAYGMIASGMIVDTKTILLLQHAALAVFKGLT